MGVASLLPTFLHSRKWSFLALFHNTEQRDKTDYNPAIIRTAASPNFDPCGMPGHDRPVGQKWLKNVRRHLWTIPYLIIRIQENV